MERLGKMTLLIPYNNLFGQFKMFIFMGREGKVPSLSSHDKPFQMPILGRGR